MFCFLLSVGIKVLRNSLSYSSYFCSYKIDILKLTMARLAFQIFNLLQMEIEWVFALNIFLYFWKHTSGALGILGYAQEYSKVLLEATFGELAELVCF